MQIQSSFQRVDEALRPFTAVIGEDLPGYRNHVYRVLHYFRALSGTAVEVPESVLIAAAFHDIGIWTDHTFDYLPPSVREARDYLKACGLEHLGPEVDALISEHHKIRSYRLAYATTVETYRQADLVDLSLGAFRFGLPRAYIRSVKTCFPNAGFHRRLAVLAARQFWKSPLRPLPMIRW
jgi:HD domain